MGNPVDDRFQDFLLSLEDQEFFAVMRNYLGPLSTPFNKQNLISRLQRFLTNPETISRIRAYLDQEDRELLAAIFYFGDPTERDLHFFFGEAHGYLDLHTRLLNLQDRLLILADPSNHRITVNPLVEDVLKAEVSADALIPTRRQQATVHRESWLHASLLAALATFLREYPELRKGDGSLRKRAEEGVEERFPSLVGGSSEGESRLPNRLELLLNGAVGLELFIHRNGRYLLQERALKQLARYSNEWVRFALLAAAAGSETTDELYSMSNAVADLLSQLDPSKAYEPVRLGRYLGMILGRYGANREKGEGLLSRMTEGGLLFPAEDGYLSPISQSGADSWSERKPSGTPGGAGTSNGAPTGRTAGRGGTLLSPNFELTLPQDAPLADHVVAARAGRILRYDRFCRYEITRDSFLAGCRGRADGEKRIGELEELAGRLPQNISTTLGAWVSEYGAFRLMEGVVLHASGEQATLLDHAPAIQPYLKERLAEGVYLLEGREEEWRRALAEIGFEQVPPVERGERGAAAGPFIFEPDREQRRSLGGAASPEGFTSAGALAGEEEEPPEMADERGAGALQEQLREEIEQMRAGEEIKLELNRRLEMKLLLYPEQLTNDAARRAVAEARGLDYLGKIRIIEAALSESGDLLEVLTRKAGGEPKRILLRPSSLAKGGTDVILHGTSLPENRPTKVQVRKISLLRKLTGTLIRRL